MRRPKIGLSACFFHSDPKRPIFKGKTLLYLEESLNHWIQSERAITYLIPTIGKDSPLSISEYANHLDGLVLQGGSDVAPESYGEKALKPEWGGDRVRDLYEIALMNEFRAQGKPVLGICRGLQLMNVAFGGTLFQDIGTQMKTQVVHRDWEIYDQNFHNVTLEENSTLESLFEKSGPVKVNSIHHQGIRDLGKGLKVEARSTDDGLIEAISALEGPFALSVQWHPEFHRSEQGCMDGNVFLRRFLKEC